MCPSDRAEVGSSVSRLSVLFELLTVGTTRASSRCPRISTSARPTRHIRSLFDSPFRRVGVAGADRASVSTSGIATHEERDIGDQEDGRGCDDGPNDSSVGARHAPLCHERENGKCEDR
jgi:hypothetical protein